MAYADPADERRKQQEWQRANRSHLRAYHRAYYRRHKAKLLKTMRQRYRRNKKAIRAKKNAYYQSRLVAVAAWRKDYRSRNLDKLRGWERDRQNCRRAAAVGQLPIDYEAVLAAADGICPLCRTPLEPPIEYDHVVPLSKGGAHARENLQAVHRGCNRRKKDRMPEVAA